jgi:hypothetical protein
VEFPVDVMRENRTGQVMTKEQHSKKQNGLKPMICGILLATAVTPLYDSESTKY